MTGQFLSRVCVDSADDVRAHSDCTVCERGAGNMHTPEAHDAISAEMVRLTLGGRGADRPELVRAVATARPCIGPECDGECYRCPDCGYLAGSFACRIRHVHLNTGDAKASRD